VEEILLTSTPLFEERSPQASVLGIGGGGRTGGLPGKGGVWRSWFWLFESERCLDSDAGNGTSLIRGMDVRGGEEKGF